MVLLIGFRFEVGGDWPTYLQHIEHAEGRGFLEYIGLNDPAYYALSWAGANIGGGIYLVNTICAAIFVWGLLSFCRAQPLPWLTLSIAIPYLVTVVAMGYSRQAVAVGLSMIAFLEIGRSKLLRSYVLISLAVAFHKSALVLIPLTVLVNSKRLWITLPLAFAVGAVLYLVFLRSYLSGILENYLGAQYQSSGAAVRMAMNILPAVVFLLLRRKFLLPPIEKRLWTFLSIGACLAVVLLYVSPSSTIVDRLALYLIPLQLFVWGRLPVVVGRLYGRNIPHTILVLTYSGIVLFTWLLFSVHAEAWLPYRSYLFQGFN